MKTLLIELDDETATRLDRVAPAKSRRRSEFIRAAIRRALWEVDEEATRAAYERAPDAELVLIDPRAWEPRAQKKVRR